MPRILLFSCLFVALGCGGAFAAPPAVPHAKPLESTPMNEKPLPEIQKSLEDLVENLEMPSETDAPFRVFALEIESFEAEKLPEILKLERAQPLDERDLIEFFEAAATEEEWMDDEEKKRAARFAKLRDFLANELENTAVYTFGETEMDVVIIGKNEGGFVGVVTLVVET